MAVERVQMMKRGESASEELTRENDYTRNYRRDCSI